MTTRMGSARQQSAGHPLRRAARTAVESLEVRRLFAVLTVNSTLDSDNTHSTLTLREAIEVVNGDIDPSMLTHDEQLQVNIGATTAWHRRYDRFQHSRRRGTADRADQLAAGDPRAGDN